MQVPQNNNKYKKPMNVTDPEFQLSKRHKEKAERRGKHEKRNRASIKQQELLNYDSNETSPSDYITDILHNNPPTIPNEVPDSVPVVQVSDTRIIEIIGKKMDDFMAKQTEAMIKQTEIMNKNYNSLNSRLSSIENVEKAKMEITRKRGSFTQNDQSLPDNVSSKMDAKVQRVRTTELLKPKNSAQLWADKLNIKDGSVIIHLLNFLSDYTPKSFSYAWETQPKLEFTHAEALLTLIIYPELFHKKCDRMSSEIMSNVFRKYIESHGSILQNFFTLVMCCETLVQDEELIFNIAQFQSLRQYLSSTKHVFYIHTFSDDEIKNLIANETQRREQHIPKRKRKNNMVNSENNIKVSKDSTPKYKSEAVTAIFIKDKMPSPEPRDSYENFIVTRMEDFFKTLSRKLINATAAIGIAILKPILESKANLRIDDTIYDERRYQEVYKSVITKVTGEIGPILEARMKEKEERKLKQRAAAAAEQAAKLAASKIAKDNTTEPVVKIDSEDNKKESVAGVDTKVEVKQSDDKVSGNNTNVPEK